MNALSSLDGRVFNIFPDVFVIRTILGSQGNGLGDPSLQATIFIQYPFCAGGNLSQWLKAEGERVKHALVVRICLTIRINASSSEAVGAAGHRPANPLCAALPSRQRGHTQGLYILSGNEINGNGKPFIVQHCHQYTRISNLRTSFCMKMAGSYLQILSWPRKRGGDQSITASDHLRMVCKIFMGITHTASFKGFTCVSRCGGGFG